MSACTNQVTVGWSNFAASENNGDGRVTRKCGTQYAGEAVLCAKHEAEAAKVYPQGWTGYPGDTCPHGVYVGGCAEDHMCGACEAGE